MIKEMCQVQTYVEVSVLNLIIKNSLFLTTDNLVLIYVLPKTAVQGFIKLQATNLQVYTIDLEVEYCKRVQIIFIKYFL